MQAAQPYQLFSAKTALNTGRERRHPRRAARAADQVDAGRSETARRKRAIERAQDAVDLRRGKTLELAARDRLGDVDARIVEDQPRDLAVRKLALGVLDGFEDLKAERILDQAQQL